MKKILAIFLFTASFAYAEPVTDIEDSYENSRETIVRCDNLVPDAGYGDIIVYVGTEVYVWRDPATKKSYYRLSESSLAGASTIWGEAILEEGTILLEPTNGTLILDFTEKSARLERDSGTLTLKCSII